MNLDDVRYAIEKAQEKIEEYKYETAKPVIEELQKLLEPNEYIYTAMGCSCLWVIIDGKHYIRDEDPTTHEEPPAGMSVEDADKMYDAESDEFNERRRELIDLVDNISEDYFWLPTYIFHDRIAYHLEKEST